MKMNADLGMKYDMEPCCPCPVKGSGEHYPSFHYEGPEELELPHSGEMVIRFVKTHSGEDSRGGKTRYSCTVEVREIVSVKGSEAKKSASKETEEALDSIARSKMSESDEEDY